MENFTLIDYHQTRDFSRKMNVTFEFVRQNFKPLGKSILFIAGPPVLLASLLMGSFFNDMFSASFSMGRGSNPEVIRDMFLTPNFWLQLLLMCVFLMVSTVATIATINNYILLYEERKTNRIEVGDVWGRVRDTFWMYFGTALLFTIVSIAVYIAMVIPVVLLANVSLVLIVFGGMALFCLLVYLLFSSSLVFIIRAYERIGFFAALARSFKLVQGKWWSTFGLIIVLYIIVVVVSYVFMIPWYVITLVSSLHNAGVEGVGEPTSGFQTISLIFLTLYYLAQMVMYTLPNVGIAFQYFNLVERKEAKGLMSQIGSIGQAPAPTPSSAPDEHY
ncbi:hypothetical protein KK083_17475 [Fulvivirgaceae bacterium PWU4]|uniref:Glycerophosphoryl diester phosphodiesterase membrane domain-containing protein n=1 Tax=Chryseosolibacter histidini TaxID=2782349 RepID=A0AAP2DP69_9BACT|nr:hypothetical protein [Chryseosolibacter histidini]MBT1698687.1 hypothetical protein [Chryseosolibacter histidini]